MPMPLPPRALAVAAISLFAGAASAADPFSVSLTVGSQSGQFSFKSAEDAVNTLESGALRNRFSYTGVEPLSALIDYRGLPISLSYPTTGSTTLDFVVPELNLSRSFAGAGASTDEARDNAQDQLADFLKSGDLLGQIMKRLAAVSPVDPIAGNPNSLQSHLVAQDFDNAFTSHSTNVVAGAPAAGGSASNLVGVGLRFGSYSTAGMRSTSWTLPLSYTIRPSSDPGRQLSFHLPLTLADTEGAKSYYAGLGANYRVPMNPRWSLTPGVNWAITGSRDLGSAAQIASASLTSAYTMPMQANALSIGNMIGYYRTLKFSAGGYSFDPDIQNVVLRNGLMYSTPVSWFGGGFAVEYSFVNTYFTGTELYNRMYNQVGATLGTARSATASSYLRAGGTYTFSSKGRGFSLNVGYWF